MSLKLFFFSILTLISLSASAQIANDIIGTWQLRWLSNGGGPITNVGNLKRFKMYTPGVFSVIEMLPGNSMITTTLFGRYELKDSLYTEQVFNSNRPNGGLLGGPYDFVLEFRGTDTLFQIGSMNGVKSTECWVRMTGNTTDNNAGFLRPLYILENTGEEILSGVDGISHIPQIAVKSITVVKEDGVRLYGPRGRAGVIYFKIADDRLEEVLKLIKTAKIKRMDEIEDVPIKNTDVW